jgi:LSD1 subclass zinc finger protein
MSELVCGGCFTMLVYNRGAANIRCPHCGRVNSTRSGKTSSLPPFEEPSSCTCRLRVAAANSNKLTISFHHRKKERKKQFQLHSPANSVQLTEGFCS